MRSSRLFLALTLCTLLGAVLCSRPGRSAQAPAADSVEGFFNEVVDVEVVEIEVRVTDRKGRPVRGLTRDDFQLMVDRNPVDVEYFRAVGFDGDGSGSAPPREGTSSEGIEQRQPPAAGNLPAEQSLVIFLDQLHLTTPGRRELVKALGPFLEHSVDPEIPVMVVSSAGGLRVVQKLTRDRSKVLSALTAEDRAVPGGIQNRVAQARTAREIREILDANKDCPLGDPCDCAVPQMLATARVRAGEATGRVEGTLGALETLTAALRGLPGSKTVLVASDGLDFRPGIDLYQMVSDLCPTHELDVTREITNIDLTPVYQRLTAHAAASRVTFYTLDTSGIPSSGPGVDDRGSLTRRARQVREMNLKHSLFVLADETGGQAVFNANRFDERLEDISRDLDAYYSLGFTPDHPGEDRVHTIDVAVAGAHHDVRYRRAFRHLSLDGRIAERMLGTLLFGVEQNPLGVAATVAVADQAPGADQAGGGAAGKVEVAVKVHLPLEAFILNPGAEDAVGLSRLVMTVQDVNGEWAPIRQKRVPIRLNEGEDPASAARDVEVDTELAPGDYLLALGVRDEIGGTVSYLRKTFTVPPRTGAADVPRSRREKPPVGGGTNLHGVS